MQRLTESDMLQFLQDVPAGSLLFVSYEAGKEPTERARKEAERHAGPHRYFTGVLEDVWCTKNNEWVMRIFAFNRDTLKNGKLQEGGYRTFNPSKGTLILVDVIRHSGDA